MKLLNKLKYFFTHKYVVLYFLVDSANLNEDGVPNILTITSDKKDCDEYLDTYLMIDNMSHFKGWCGVRGLDVNAKTSWESYKKNVLSNIKDKEHSYEIHEMLYSIKNVAHIYRLYGDTLPIGCSFEEEDEFLNILDKLPEEAQEEVKKLFKN